MSATVYGDSKWAVDDDTAATGLLLENFSQQSTTETAYAKDHTGSDAAMAIYNPKKELSFDGTIEVEATGFVPLLAAVVTPANDFVNAGVFGTVDANAAFVITDITQTRTNTDFEKASATAVLNPLIDTSAPTTIN
jgi:hypothetical protein